MSTPHLDPATCMALKPIMDVGRQAQNERDAYNTWTVDLACILKIPLDNPASEDITEQYAELRERITKAVKEMKR